MRNKSRNTTLELPNHPVDHGWAWVVLTGCCLAFMIYLGTVKSAGMFFVAFIGHFQSTASTVSLISGVLQITYSALSIPIMTLGLHHFSVRQIIITGGVLGSIAYFIGFFVRKIEILILTHGFIYGIGMACMHGPSAYLLGVYFDRRREMATSFLLAATGVGGLVLPPLYRYLLDEYGLNGTLLITSGLILNVVALGCLLRPIEFFQKVQIKELGDCKNENDCHFNGIDVNKHGSQLTTPLRTRAFSLNENYKESGETIDSKWGSLPNNLNRKINESYISRKFKKLGSTDGMNSFSQLQIQEEGHNSKRTDSSKIFDLSLLKKPLLQMFVLAYSFGSVGSAYGHVFIPPYAIERGISDNDVSILVSIANTFDFIGRLICGVVADRRILKNSHIVIISQLMTGGILCTCSFYKPFWSYVIYSSIYGLFSGGIIALAPAILVDFVGLQSFRSAFGIITLCQGLAMGGGAPFLGYVRDRTGTFTTTLYCLGGCLLFSAILMCLEPLVRLKQNKLDNVNPSEAEEHVQL